MPLYRMYCQATGQGTASTTGHKDYRFEDEDTDVASLSEKDREAFTKRQKQIKERIVKIIFQATVHESLTWEFVPQQRHLYVAAGETALAFYRAKNNADRPIIGNAVYSVLPPDAGIYFNKIQCFCFDEQLINPGEEVDLPILFYVDPEFATDSRTHYIDDITLSYVFFESGT